MQESLQFCNMVLQLSNYKRKLLKTVTLIAVKLRNNKKNILKQLHGKDLMMLYGVRNAARSKNM